MARDYWCVSFNCKQKGEFGQGAWVHRATYYHHKTADTSSSNCNTSSSEQYKCDNKYNEIDTSENDH